MKKPSLQCFFESKAELFFILTYYSKIRTETEYGGKK